MTVLDSNSVTHWCCGCDTHYQLRQVRHCIPAPTTPEGEVEVNICPQCGSYDVVELKDEVDHAQ